VLCGLSVSREVMFPEKKGSFSGCLLHGDSPPLLHRCRFYPRMSAERYAAADDRVCIGRFAVFISQAGIGYVSIWVKLMPDF